MIHHHQPADIPIDFHFNFARYLLFRSRIWLLYSINIRERERAGLCFQTKFPKCTESFAKICKNMGIVCAQLVNY